MVPRLRADRAVREGTLKQASDIVTPIYGAWKEVLKAQGVRWQDFQSAASRNEGAWRRWLNGYASWNDALVGLVEQVKLNTPGAQLAVALSD